MGDVERSPRLVDVGSRVGFGINPSNKSNHKQQPHNFHSFVRYNIKTALIQLPYETKSISSGRLTDMGLAHVVDGHGVFGDDVSHLLDLLLQFGDVIVVFADGRLCFAVLLLKNLLLGCYSLQLLRQ